MNTTTDTTNSFASLPLTPAFLANLVSLGYHEMTTIQAQSLPAVLDGRDLIAQAKTGSGKTAACSDRASMRRASSRNSAPASRNSSSGIPALRI